MSEYEDIYRAIRRLEERIKARQEIIDYFEILQEERRKETGLSHEELMITDAEYREREYRIRSLKGWQTRDRKRLEELKRLIPPYKYIIIELTFSIETGVGHEPFYAEVTAITMIEKDKPEPLRRIVNAVLKLFFIHFDGTKMAFDTGKHELIVEHMKRIWRSYEVTEEYMDRWLKACFRLIPYKRPLDQYVTREAIIKIGASRTPAIEEEEVKYPRVKCTIEVPRRELAIEKIVIVAPETDVDIIEWLGMRVIV